MTTRDQQIAAAVIEAAVQAVPGGSICDPQQIADEIRALDLDAILASVSKQVDADLDALQALAEARNLIGAQLANVAFNWSQQIGYALTSDDCEMLRDLYKQWDASVNVIPTLDRLRKAEAAIDTLKDVERIQKERGDAYLFDAIDNDGVLYQSQYLAGLLAAPDGADSGKSPYWLCCGSHDPNNHHKSCHEAKAGHPERCRFGTAEEHSAWQRR